MRPKIVCKIHVLIKAVWEEKPTQQSFVDYKQMKRQMFLQFLFQNLHHLLSVSMTLTGFKWQAALQTVHDADDSKHGQMVVNTLGRLMFDSQTVLKQWSDSCQQKSDGEALGKFKGLAVRYLQAPDEWRQCGGHTASARCTWESSNDSTLSTFYWNVDAVHGAVVLGPVVDGDPEYTP